MEKLSGGIPVVVNVVAGDTLVNQPCRQVFVDGSAGVSKFKVKQLDGLAEQTIVHNFDLVNPLNVVGIITTVYKEYKANTDITSTVYGADGNAVIGLKIMP